MSADDLERFLAHAAANARGSAASAKILSLDALRARHGGDDARDALTKPAWSLSVLRGRLVELSARGASATLTAATEIVAEAQAESEPVAWLTLATSSFYPPDVADTGIDLAALVVIRAPDILALARAAERCLRSGAFGLVVLDLGAPQPGAELSMQIQGRLVTLAQTHDAAVVCLTEKTADTASLGSLVSLRAQALRTRRDPRDHRALREGLLRARPSPSPPPPSPQSTSVVALAATHPTSELGDAQRTLAPHVVLAALAHRATRPSPPADAAINPPEEAPGVDVTHPTDEPSDFEIGVSVLKDKRRGPGMSQALLRRGPAGL